MDWNPSFAKFKSWLPNPETPREKNLWAVLIALSGLFVGSLFVDMGQLITGQGFSGHALRTHSIIESQGKTWVAYSEPKVGLQVLTDSNCADCNPDEALAWIRRIVPTVDAEKIEAATPQGKRLIQNFGVRTVPSFIFSKSVNGTDFYNEAQSLFSEKNGQFVFDMTKIGLPVGKYLQAPSIAEGDIQVGEKSAPVTFMVFTDFDCQYCRAYHIVVKHILEDYAGKVRFVYKALPLPSHPQAENAALAAYCANEEGHFPEYADLLFANPADWDQTTGTGRFKTYVFRVRGMDPVRFAACLDSGKYQSTIETDLQDAQDWNVSAAPASFINTEFVNGAAPYPDVKAIVEEELSRKK